MIWGSPVGRVELPFTDIRNTGIRAGLWRKFGVANRYPSGDVHLWLGILIWSSERDWTGDTTHTLMTPRFLFKL